MASITLYRTRQGNMVIGYNDRRMALEYLFGRPLPILIFSTSLSISLFLEPYLVIGVLERFGCWFADINGRAGRILGGLWCGESHRQSSEHNEIPSYNLTLETGPLIIRSKTCSIYYNPNP